jgi:hypothetical protein
MATNVTTIINGDLGHISVLGGALFGVSALREKPAGTIRITATDYAVDTIGPDANDNHILRHLPAIAHANVITLSHNVGPGQMIFSRASE